jgi:hypothetical protein
LNDFTIKALATRFGENPGVEPGLTNVFSPAFAKIGYGVYRPVLKFNELTHRVLHFQSGLPSNLPLIYRQQKC